MVQPFHAPCTPVRIRGPYALHSLAVVVVVSLPLVTSIRQSVCQPSVAPRGRTRGAGMFVRLVAAVALVPGTASGQSAVRGVVMDAANDRPIVGAVVSLRAGSRAETDRESERRCTLPLPDARMGSATRTDAQGAYAFSHLTPGRYSLCVRAVGYVPRALTVTIDSASSPRVYVGLPALPTVLAPVRVTRVPEGTFAAVQAGASAAPPAALERLRQARYLTSDARLLTRDDATLASGLGELDALRAVQQVPGVTARDDYTTVPWTRGAPGDQTMVTFDGLPLLAPYHGVGAISGVNADAVGEAVFHPGVAPTEIAGGAAGTLAIRSRRPTVSGLDGAVGISTVAASVTADAATRGRRVAGTLSARRSHLELTNRLATRLGAESDRGLPYAFSDVTGRGDVALGAWHLEGSGLVALDRLWAPIDGIVDGGTGRWGSHAARLTLARELGRGTLEASGGSSGARTSLLARSDVALEPAGLPQDSGLYAVRETVFRPQPIESRAQVLMATLAWREDPDDVGVSRASGGIEIAAWQARFTTEGPWPHSAQFIDTVAVRSTTTIASLWAERAWQPSAALSARTGARLELGGPPRNAPRVRLAPRVSARYELSSATSVALAAGGAYQHAQAVAPPGPGRNAVATTNAFWLLSGPDVPVLATRIATAGAEHWVTPTVLASTTLYWRDDAGVLLPDPREGYLVDRPLAVEGASHTVGGEGSVRAMGSRWAGGLSYSLGRSRTTAYGLRFASPSERPSVLRASAAARARRHAGDATNVRLGLAWEYATGAPFTRYYGSVARCDAFQRCRWEPPPRIGPPSEGRGRPTHRLDATVDATWVARAVRLDGYLQLRNVTRVANDAAYLATVGRCPANTGETGTCQPELFPAAIDDTRLPPLRGWLAVGVRLAPRRTP